MSLTNVITVCCNLLSDKAANEIKEFPRKLLLDRIFVRVLTCPDEHGGLVSLYYLFAYYPLQLHCLLLVVLRYQTTDIIVDYTKLRQAVDCCSGS